MDGTSSDAELSDWGKQDMHFTSQVTQSKQTVDRRLIDIFRLRLAERAGESMVKIEELNSSKS